MIRCPSCSAEWPSSARFCGACGSRLERACGSCGETLAAGARFCLACGTPIAEAATSTGSPQRATPPAEERRAVTILFADLVGFTERSDRADPEDVRTTLVPFHARAKADIERFGGTLDKFIGDAVMGVFGAPVAHEDDPLRAIRAALRILRSIDELRAHDPALQVRVAINTGEAVVALGDGPQIGEAVAGDVVNTASRMQALAPPGGIVIGETTLRHVRDHVVADPLPPATVKGKAEPIVVWHVLGERDPASTPRVPGARFVGRERELSLLSELFERVRAAREPHVATVIGEAGIGKTRLVEELRTAVGDGGSWMEARCLPYGEAVLAPIADLAAAAAGIAPTDPPATASAKLRSAFDTASVDAVEARGLASRLERAFGIVEAEDAGEVTPAELGGALGALLAAMPEPSLVVVQDVHWADALVLDVLAHAVGRLAGRPALLVTTARPELDDRDLAWPPSGARSTTLRLSPLSHDQMETLVASLVAGARIDAEARASMLERSGGNPLFALEYVRMLMDDAPAVDSVPDTIQALIAARIDAVPAAARTRLLDASVVGSEFWPALLAALGDAPEHDVGEDLTALVERGLVRPAPSSLDGQPAFAFTHDLIREVAHARLPRVERARRHVETAEWLGAVTGERHVERAEQLAQHYGTAFELAEAAHDRALAERVRTPAARWLLEAGRRALPADPRGAFLMLDRAAAIAEPGTADRSDALVLSGFAGRRSGMLAAPEVLARYEQGEAARRAVGDPTGVGEALVRMSSQLAVMGRVAESRRRLADAIQVLETVPPGRQLASAYAHRAEDALFAGDVVAAMTDAARTLRILGEDSMDELVVMALHIRGDARCSLGDRGGLADLERALEISNATQRSSDVVTSESYVGDWTIAFAGPAEGLRHYEHAIATAERRGVVSQGLWVRAGSLFALYELGRDEDVLRRAGEILALGKDRLDATVWVFAEVFRTEVLLDLGRGDETIRPADLLAHARLADDVQAVAPALLAAARRELVAGDATAAEAHVREFAALTEGVAREYREAVLARAARLAVGLGLADVLRALVDASDDVIPHHGHNLASARAALLELEGSFGRARDAYLEAARAWETFGSVREAAFARTGADRCAARFSPLYSPGLDRTDPKEG